MSRIIVADVMDGLRQLSDESVHCCVTSPPYWGLRDYGVPGQLGLEPTPDEYVARMVAVFREVRRVLRADGTLWLNLGDSYASTTGVQTNHPQQSRNGQQGVVGPRDKHPSASRANLSAFKDFTGLKPKDLVGIPWRVAFALQADGWWLRQDIIWAKPNPMPESVTDRCTKAHEYIFLLSKSARYWYDAEAVKEEAAPDSERKRCSPNAFRGAGHFRDGDGAANREGRDMTEIGRGPNRNARSVWTIATAPYPEAHFATFPPALPERCIKAGCPAQCCPACGAGWERVVERTTATPGQRPGYARDCTGRNDGDRAGNFTDQTAKTIGFRPTCTCAATTSIPGTVLDPFGGAGTTGLVARQLGREYILIELNPKYADMAERRIAAYAPLFAEVSPCPSPARAIASSNPDGQNRPAP